MKYGELSPLDAQHEGVRDHVANALQLARMTCQVHPVHTIYPHDRDVWRALRDVTLRLHKAITLLDQEVAP